MRPTHSVLFTSILFCLAFLLSQCAVLHNTTIGDIDSRQGDLVPFEVKVSESTVDLDEAMQMASALSRSRQASDDLQTVRDVISLFQFGRRTGTPVYTDKHAENMLALLIDQCPTGRVTGLQSVRESAEYPVIKGEIVKIKGFCVR